MDGQPDYDKAINHLQNAAQEITSDSDHWGSRTPGTAKPWTLLDQARAEIAKAIITVNQLKYSG